MTQNSNYLVFAVAFIALMAAQAYVWQARAIPRPAEDGPAPMDDSRIDAILAEGKPFIRFFYTNSCGFATDTFRAAEILEQQYPLERINAAEHCWSGKKIADCPQMVPAFVIYSNGEKITVYGNRSIELLENVTRYGKAAMAGEPHG